MYALMSEQIIIEILSLGKPPLLDLLDTGLLLNVRDRPATLKVPSTTRVNLLVLRSEIGAPLRGSRT